MTDEEMAEANWRSKCLGYKVNTDERAYKDGFLAGLKAGKDMNVPIKWHKVADGDLPNDKHIKALENENNQLKSRLEEIKRKAEFLQFLILNA
jgi:hypothetical protein